MTPAVVMNVFYTGLGIARSLGEKGIPVVGLTSHRRTYGTFTRYAKSVFCPDSRNAPEQLAEFLIRLAPELGGRAVLFPTRDDDLLMLDRFRRELEPYFSLVMPPPAALHASLNKWETFLAARKAGVPAPNAWVLEGWDDVERARTEATYPCVLKPLSAHYWRQGGNWRLVGERKAIGIGSERELLIEYRTIARADRRALLQELVPGADDCLVVAACYLDRQSRWVAGFNATKILQVPEGFGTGCIVQSTACPELFDPTRRLLETIGYQGIAEVEYKWDGTAGQYKLIEINPRPWDQHRLGNAAGVDLIHMAYCEHAALPLPPVKRPVTGRKWLAEDTFAKAVLHSLRTRKGVGRLLRLARGRRIYGIWSARDPLPSIAYWLTCFIPEVIVALWRRACSALGSCAARVFQKKGRVYETRIKKPESFG